VRRLTLDRSIAAKDHERTVLRTEAAGECRIRRCQPIASRPLRRTDMKALTSASQGFVTEVSVEGNDGEPVGESVLDEGLIVFGFDSSIPRSYDPMTPPIQKEDHRLDHVLVSEKG
jgi:hypothetical protein